MLNKTIILICILCNFNILFDINIGNCSANVNTCSIYMETLWINLDITMAQQKKIDEIIGAATYDINSLQQKPNSISNIFEALEYEKSVNDKRLLVNDQIMQVLSEEQQDIFSSQLKKQEQSQNISTAALLNLDLSEKQSLLVLQVLMKSQNKVWSIVSDKSISWEARRKKINNINVFENISYLLTKKQLIDLNLWNESLKLLQH